MSQEPPPPDQQPYTPYSQGGYPNPYAHTAQQRNRTTRNILLIVGAVILVFCAGGIAFVVWIVVQLGHAFDTEFEGSRDDPLTVTEGQAFSIRGFDYDAGWSVVTNGPGVEVADLRTTNDRDDEGAGRVQLRFDLFRDDVPLATVYCSAGDDIGFERTARLSCITTSADVTGFDEIEVFDASFE